MSKKPNILFLGIDTLRANHMSLYGYEKCTTPHIDKFFGADSIVCDNAFSPSIPTPPGYASMLSGMDCFSTNVVALRMKEPMAEEIITLPELLRERGYESTSIGFDWGAFARGFDNYLNPKVSWGSWADGPCRKGESLNEVALSELDRLNDSGKPFMLFLRYMDPHAPYLPPQPFDRMFYQGDEYDKSNKSLDDVYKFKPFCDFFKSWFPPNCTDADYIIAQYDGAVAYMDACIAQVFEKLRQLGIEDDTIVVITTDHGETFMENGYYFDHHGLYDYTIRVPLAIRWKGHINHTRVQDVCQLKDIMPTLTDMMGLNPKIKYDGQSLLPLTTDGERISEPEMYITECTWQRKHGWRTPQWKLIIALEPDFHYKEPKELYNLIKDPAEKYNVIAENPEIAKALEKRMLKHIKKREKEVKRTAPMYTNLSWNDHGKPFESSDEAYNSLYIGGIETARKLQAQEK